MAKVTGSNKKMTTARRAGVAKAGKRRPPHIKSVKDRNGRRDWVAA